MSIIHNGEINSISEKDLEVKVKGKTAIVIDADSGKVKMPLGAEFSVPSPNASAKAQDIADSLKDSYKKHDALRSEHDNLKMRYDELLVEHQKLLGEVNEKNELHKSAIDGLKKKVSQLESVTPLFSYEGRKEWERHYPEPVVGGVMRDMWYQVEMTRDYRWKGKIFITIATNGVDARTIADRTSWVGDGLEKIGLIIPQPDEKYYDVATHGKFRTKSDEKNDVVGISSASGMMSVEATPLIPMRGQGPFLQQDWTLREVWKEDHRILVYLNKPSLHHPETKHLYKTMDKDRMLGPKEIEGPIYGYHIEFEAHFKKI